MLTRSRSGRRLRWPRFCTPDSCTPDKIVSISRNMALVLQAIADYSKAITIEPGNVSAFFNRGLIFFQKEMFDQASGDFSRVLKVQDDPQVRDLRAIAYSKLGNLGGELADLTAILKVAPDAESVLLRRAQAYDNLDSPLTLFDIVPARA